jgi:lipoate-protein ligase B
MSGGWRNPEEEADQAQSSLYEAKDKIERLEKELKIQKDLLVDTRIELTDAKILLIRIHDKVLTPGTAMEIREMIQKTLWEMLEKE